MLKVATRSIDLSVGALMELYAEEIFAQAQRDYPGLSPWEQRLEAEQDFRAFLREGFFTRPGDTWCLWEIGGVYLSGLRLQTYRDGLLLEGLVTAPAHRGRGYAQRLICSVLAQIGPGKVYAHIHKDNDVSAAVHEKCGFRRILDYSRMADGSFAADHGTYLYEIPDNT